MMNDLCLRCYENQEISFSTSKNRVSINAIIFIFLLDVRKQLVFSSIVIMIFKTSMFISICFSKILVPTFECTNKIFINLSGYNRKIHVFLINQDQNLTLFRIDPCIKQVSLIWKNTFVRVVDREGYCFCVPNNKHFSKVDNTIIALMINHNI